MSPSRVLKLYYVASFVLGCLLTLVSAHWVSSKEIGMRGAAIIILSFNVLLIMLLPLVLDWAERRYFKARFMGLEDIAKTNPDLAVVLEEQCKRLAIAKLRLAIVESPANELFSYGLWRINPRLVLSHALLAEEHQVSMIPSIEAELVRFASQDMTVVFLMFTVAEELLQIVLIRGHIGL
jgi:Zn-dependent protease with chaperone function